MSAECPTEGDEWEVSKLDIEHNATDEGTGVHGFFGGTLYELEVLAIEDSGNQTIALGCFMTE